MQQNKPTVKISELNAKLNQLTCAILAQRQEIESLELLKNQAILCVKNYQKDIELLQNVAETHRSSFSRLYRYYLGFWLDIFIRSLFCKGVVPGNQIFNVDFPSIGSGIGIINAISCNMESDSAD